MSLLTQANQEKIRSFPKNTKLYLSIYQPTTVFNGRVDDATIEKGARVIPYDTSTKGSYLNIKEGMTMWVGTSVGLADKGKVRIRDADASTITVAENSHIDWEDNDYFTVVNFFEINAIYPRIIQDPSDETQLLWYMDYDLEYTNQNTVIGTFINMGSHYAGFLDSGLESVYYSASGTSSLTGDTLSYHWHFEGAITTGSNAQNPGWIGYDTPGHYRTTLIVSGSATGAVDVSYRHISIYERPEDGTNNPILNWELEKLSGNREKGGYIGEVRIHQTVDESLVKDGSLVVIFSEDWYNNEKISLGGNYENRSSIFFVGYVLNGSIEYNYRNSTVTFEIGSPSEVMKYAEGFSSSLEDSTDPAGQADSDEDYPSGWVLLKDMTVKRALYTYLRWYTSALKCVDFSFVGNDRNIQYFDSDRTSLYEALNIIDGALMGDTSSDRQGHIRFETPIWSVAESAFYSSQMGLTSQDWIGEPTLTEQNVNNMSFVEMGGIAWSSAATGTFSALMCAAPGEAPGYRGTVERRQGLALVDQGQLNLLGGDYFAFQNRRYPILIMTMAGDYRNLDISPQEYVPITLDAEDTVRGITFTRKNFFVQSIDYEYSPKQETLLASVGFTEVTTGFAADTIPVPPVPDEGEDGGSYSPPAFTIPPLPSISISLSVPPIFSPPMSFYDPLSVEPNDLEYDSDVGGYLWDSNAGNYYAGIGGIAIPPIATGVLVYLFLRIPSAAPAAGDISVDWDIYSNELSLTTDVGYKVNQAAGQTIAIPKPSSGGRAVTPLLANIPAGGDGGSLQGFDPGGLIRWEAAREAADSNDTYSGDIAFQGLLFIFY